MTSANLFPQAILDATSYTVLDVTTKDLDVYVSPAGSDTTGDGSIGKPFATVTRAYASVPRKVAHKVHIIVTGSLVAAGSFPRTIDPEYVEEGCLSIYGKAAPTRKATRGGPWTVTVSASVTGGVARKVTIGAAAGWVADEFVGYWCRVVTGTNVGYTFPVYGNSTTYFFIPAATLSVCVDDTIEFITPAVKIPIGDVAFIYNKHTAWCPAPITGFDTSSLVIANLWLDASASTSTYGQFLIQSSMDMMDGPLFEFVRFDSLDSGVSIINTSLSEYAALDWGYTTDCDAVIANLNSAIEGPALSIVNAGGRAGEAVLQTGGVIYAAAILGTVSWQGDTTPFFCGGCAAIAKWTDRGSAQCWLAGVDDSTPGIKNANGDYKIWIEGACNYAIDGDTMSIIYMHSANHCSSTLCGTAIAVGEQGRVMIHDNCADFIGSAAGKKAYFFKGKTSVKSNTWPNADTLTEDTRGGQILRTS